MSIDLGQRRALLSLARDAIAARLENLPPPLPATEEGALGEPRGAFVTLTIDGALRGCIGHVEPVEPLWRSVRSNAVAAAFRDLPIPVIGYAQKGRLIFDLRCLDDENAFLSQLEHLQT